MTQLKKICATFAIALATTQAFAGGILTNTNQSISFLRNPARDGAIGIDGVYSNPAGVAFLNEGFHIGFGWQAVWQNRIVNTTNPLFALGTENNGATTKEFKGDAQVPFLPTFQGAYNTGKWSFQVNFGIIGGGGSCDFNKGLGSFESAVGKIAGALNAFGAQGYNAGYSMHGKQYYFGLTLGAAYKVTDNLSVYAGVRGLKGTASYKAKISDIMVKTQNGTVPFSGFLDGTNAYIATNLANIEGGLSQIAAGLAQLEPVKDLPGYSDQYQALVAQQTGLLANQALLQGAQPQVEALGVYRDGVNLQCDQSGFGVAPILGIDYHTEKFNIAAKYEFRTHMGMKNESTLKEAMAIEAVNQFQDGKTVREDSPAYLSIGGQYNILPTLRVSAGYHHFYDKQSKKYGDKQDLLKKGTNEYLVGIEYDPIEKLTVSAGMQCTRYGLTDEYMSDLSFVTSSWSYGLGAKYQINEHVAVEAAYFKTKYEHYKQAAPDANGSINEFTRSNRVAGVGVELTF